AYWRSVLVLSMLVLQHRRAGTTKPSRFSVTYPSKLKKKYLTHPLPESSLICDVGTHAGYRTYVTEKDSRKAPLNTNYRIVILNRSGMHGPLWVYASRNSSVWKPHRCQVSVRSFA